MWNSSGRMNGRAQLPSQGVGLRRKEEARITPAKPRRPGRRRHQRQRAGEGPPEQIERPARRKDRLHPGQEILVAVLRTRGIGGGPQLHARRRRRHEPAGT